MNFDREIKEQLIGLLRIGQREQARKLLQHKFQVSNEDAEKLLQALERENPRETLVIPAITERVTTLGKNAGGCAVLVLKSMGIFFGFVTFMLYVFAAISYYTNNHFASDAAQVPGIITGLRENTDGSFAPVAEYEWEGAMKQYESTNYSRPPDYQPGDSVTLLVNMEKPGEVIIDSFTERYLISVLFGGIGTFFLFFAVVLFVVARKIKGKF